MSMTKEGRLQIRVDPVEKQLLERAAAAEHVSLSSFVLRSAAARAADVLATRQIIELDPEAAAAFATALASPGTVDQRLADALQRPRRFTWLG